MQLFVNNLTVIDYSYLCPKRGMVGESLIVDLVLDGSLNDECMVLDFGLVKKQLKKVIDEEVDHKLLIPVDHPTVSFNVLEESIQVLLDRQGELPIYLNCPHEAFALIEGDEVNEEAIIAHLNTALREVLPDNVTGLELKLAPEPAFGPFYHYSHGLKKHDGNCQRIAHGHRSCIEISRNGEEAPELANYWAERWQDIYLVTREDMVEPGDIVVPDVLEPIRNVPGMLSLSYRSAQGLFQLMIPEAHCEIVDFDSTVEQLTVYIAETLAEQHPGDTISVVGYEGVDKGALASCQR